ncbi:MAG: hypothetical protein LH617_08955, partial [Ramlibacter sp.]|nr:hypothetical protein [Ramlibacter sp.]
MTPADKLALSRLAILDYLAPKDHRKERSREQERRADAAAAAAAEIDTDADAGGRSDARKRSRWSRPRWFSGMTGVASSWWLGLPAQIAFVMLRPPLQSYMRGRPFQVLGLGVGVGV